MREAGIGRVLVASLHQAIGDILPTRLGAVSLFDDVPESDVHAVLFETTKS